MHLHLYTTYQYILPEGGRHLFRLHQAGDENNNNKKKPPVFHANYLNRGMLSAANVASQLPPSLLYKVLFAQLLSEFNTISMLEVT